MFRCQLSNEFGLGHLSGEEVPHRAVVITEKQRAFEPTLSCDRGGATPPGRLRRMLTSPDPSPDDIGARFDTRSFQSVRVNPPPRCSLGQWLQLDL